MSTSVPAAMTRRPPRHRHRRRHVVMGASVLAALGVAGSLAVATTSSAPGAVAAAPSPAGWSKVWSDEFTGAAGSLPSSQNWIFSLGHGYPGGATNWGTGEIASHTADPANVSLDGSGNLRIIPIRDGAGDWTSARIETRRTDFRPAAGGTLRIEGRLRLPDVAGPAAQGIWPAFWALGAPFRGTYTNWPAIGEIDIMENVNGLNTVYGTMHCGVAPGGPCKEFDGLGANRTGFSPSLQSAFHEYAVEWDRSTPVEQIRWYVDDVLYHSVTRNQAGADAWTQATNHGFFIILNVAVGGGWPGMPTAETASGRPMLVDYVRVLSRRGTTPTPTPTTPTTPTPNPTTPTTLTPTPTTLTTPTTPAPTSSTTGGTRDAYARIEAESFDGQQGIAVNGTGDGGRKISSIADGDHVRFDKVQFGGRTPHRFVARVSSGAPAGASGLVQVRLDSPTAAPVGSFAVANTGGSTTYHEIPGDISAVTGVHTVYLTFTSDQPAEYVDIDWLRFDGS